MQLIPLLKEVAIFQDLRASELVKISEKMERCPFVVGECICEQGAPGGEALYIIESGYVKVAVLEAEDKEEKVLTTLGPSACFGELSLLTGETHSASIVAISNGVLYKIKKTDFDRILSENPSVALFLSKMVSKKFRDLLHLGNQANATHKVISLVSSEQGTGKSTLIANLATALSRQTKKKTIAIDLNYAPGSLASVLNLQTPLSLDKVVARGRTFSFSDIEGATVRHPQGLSVLGVLAESINDAFDEDLVERLIEVLKEAYDFIFIEIPNKAESLLHKFLIKSDCVLLLVPAERRGLISSFEYLKFLKRKISDLEKRLKVVVQLSLEQKTINKKQVEKILRTAVTEILPYDAALADLLSISATPFVVSHPSAALSVVVNRLARGLGGIKVGLALSSGMAPGLAHIGVLKVFEREKIPVDVVAGTSGGALFGAALACGISAGKLEKISRDVARKFLWFYSDFVAFPYSGFLRGKTLAALINKIIKDADFDDLVIPLEILASDLVTGEPVILNEGKVSEAIRASISVPGIFTPVEVKGRYLVDGAAISPVPVSILQQAGADIVIAVNVNSAPVDTNKVVGDSSNLFARIKRAITTPNIFDIIMQSRAISSHRMAELDSSRADVVVKPDTSTIRWRDYGKARQIIEQGEKAAEQMIPRIKDLLSLAN